MDQGEHVVAKKREQGNEPGRGGIYVLQSLEHYLEPRWPDPLGGPPSGHHPTTTSS